MQESRSHEGSRAMSMDEWTWHSPALRRDMTVARWGNTGKAVLLFPTSGGDHLDVARFHIISSVQHLIEAGRVQVFSAGNVSRESWGSRTAPPWHKSFLQSRFDAYLAEELLPFIAHISGRADPRICVAGASLGAYNALNAGAKHPEWIDTTIGMSGWYDMDAMMGGYRDDNYYYNNPLYFLPNLRDDAQLHKLRQSQFILANGGGRWEHIDQAVRVANVLMDKRIPVRLEVWGPQWDHDWPTWRAMLPTFLAQIAW